MQIKYKLTSCNTFNQMEKIKFYIMGEKGYKVLEYTVKTSVHIISCVIGGRDRGVDNDYYEEIKYLCVKNKILHLDRTSESANEVEKNGYKLAVGWRWILPSDRLMVIHDSLLPKYRGFAPLVNCLINGEKQIGATVLFATDRYDEGDVIDQSSISIDYPIKINNAINMIANLYVELAARLIEKISNNENITAVKQNKSAATYSVWRDEDDYWIDWQLDSVSISRFIDAVGAPYAGARCLVNNELAVIEDAFPVDDVVVMDRRSSIGKVIYIDNGFPVIVCSKGLLKVIKLMTIEGVSMLPLSKYRTRIKGKA